jgi:predicted peroxiredoxin
MLMTAGVKMYVCRLGSGGNMGAAMYAGRGALPSIC